MLFLKYSTGDFPSTLAKINKACNKINFFIKFLLFTMEKFAQIGFQKIITSLR